MKVYHAYDHHGLTLMNQAYICTPSLKATVYLAINEVHMQEAEWGAQAGNRMRCTSRKQIEVHAHAGNRMRCTHMQETECGKQNDVTCRIKVHTSAVLIIIACCKCYFIIKVVKLQSTIEKMWISGILTLYSAILSPTLGSRNKCSLGFGFDVILGPR